MSKDVEQAITALLRPLRRERETGFRDTVVIGGVDRLLERQGRALSTLANGTNLGERLTELGVTEDFAGPYYSRMSTVQRRIWVRRALDVLQQTLGAARGNDQSSGDGAQRRQRPRKRAQQLPEDLTPQSPVSALPSVTAGTAAKMQHLGVHTVNDLLYHFPHRYVEIRRVAQLCPEEEQAVVVTVWTASRIALGSGRRGTEAVVGDETGNVRVVWFNQPYLAERLSHGSELLLTGRVGVYRGRLTLESPAVESVSSDNSLLRPGRSLPVYPTTQGLAQRTLRQATQEALKGCLSLLDDPLPETLRSRLKLMVLSDALSHIHFPASQGRAEGARKRLAFVELLLLQLWVLGQRRQWEAPGLGIPLKVNHEHIDAFFASLPFDLTGAQRHVTGQVLGDLERSVPMSRLLHGEVGSGKTVVALAALLTTALNGYQGAIMAPTEVLAEQHFLNITRMLEGVSRAWEQQHSATFYIGRHPEPVSVGLLVGSMTRKEKEETHRWLAGGALDIVVGTHALIQEDVQIPKLALAVVDEQHRFGVVQRTSLRQRRRASHPHLLVMSATPIPRTLALTLYGDLDVSVIDELPGGRQRVRTQWMRSHERGEAYDAVQSTVQEGRQAFVICPLVEESEALQARAATEEYERLSHEVFPDLRLSLLHGRMSARQKSDVMQAFRNGEADVLVSTPVVEVGVDIPNATVMLIEGADRFGLAQLHQFRGRVGRGDHPGRCLLLADAPSEDAQERLALVERVEDGFALAEEDLRLRGPGEYAGVRQSGIPDLKMARLSDQPLLDLARQEAMHILEADSHLQWPVHDGLRQALQQFAQGREPIQDVG